MRNWDAQDEAGVGVCTVDADLEDARMVAAHLGIPIETVRAGVLSRLKRASLPGNIFIVEFEALLLFIILLIALSYTNCI